MFISNCQGKAEKQGEEERENDRVCVCLSVCYVGNGYLRGQEPVDWGEGL